MGVWPLETRPSPTSVRVANFVVIGQTVGAQLRRSPKQRLTLDPFRTTFQGHVRSLKLTEIDRIPMTSYW